MPHSNKILIFCQAPADIQYALTLYERNKDTACISIFCINVIGIYEFIKSLELKLDELIYIPYDFKLSLKNPYSYFNVKKKLKNIYKKYFQNRKNYQIYFFSHFFDYLTFYMLHRLVNSNQIIFINHYDDQIARNYIRKNYRFDIILRRLILKFITGIDFKFFVFNSKSIIEFPIDMYDIHELKKDILDEDIHTKYGYKIDESKSRKALLLEMDYEKVNLFSNYKSVTLQLVNALKENNYKIYLKPHPRLGYSKFLDNYIDEIVDPSVPAEFLNPTDFDLILGINSSALAYLANRNSSKVYSLINLYRYLDDSNKSRALDYMEDLSKNIFYPNSFKELKELN